MGRSSTKKRRSPVRRYLAYLANGDARLWRRLVAGAAGLSVVAALLLVVTLAALIPFTPSLSALKSAKVQRPTVVKAAGGETIAVYRRHNREWVALSEVDTSVVQALVATEDHRFYEHPGVDVWRLVGATGRTLLGDPQGASTLPMQLARNLFPESVGRAPMPLRKLKEIVTALKIEAVYTKDEILEAYLNTVPFLYNARGIELAARTYFGKPAKALDLREAATLVGMLKATAYYNPVRHPERAVRRRNVVLHQMHKRGHLSAAYYAKLKDDPLRLDFTPQRLARPDAAPHFAERVRLKLQDWAAAEGYDLYASGLVVHTTLDLTLQKMAEAAVRRQGNALQAVADVEWGRSSADLLSRNPEAYAEARKGTKPFSHFWPANAETTGRFIEATTRFRNGIAAGASEEEMQGRLRQDAAFMDSLRTAKTWLETGFVALDPQTGAVRAWVGSRDFWKGQFDHVAAARRQPGSTFKPFLYAAALKRGIRPEDAYPNAPVEMEMENGRTWRLASASDGEMVTVREGLAQSNNAVAARLVQEVGARRTARMAERLGVRGSRLDEVPSLALGTSAVTLLEMTSAYATIAAGGLYRAPQLITRIENSEGEVLATFGEEPERVLDEETAVALLDLMRGVIDRGTGRAIRQTWGVRADVAGKTGTTQGGADGWFLLMHPQLVAGAWVGFDDPRVTFRSDHWGQGANNALRVVGDFYRQALRRGQLSPRPAFERPPAELEQPTLWARAGGWLRSAAAWTGEKLSSAGTAIAGTVKGWFDGENEAPPEEERPPLAEAEAREAEEAADEAAAPREAQPKTWNETADERRQRLERYWRETQRQRQTERIAEEVQAALREWAAEREVRLEDLSEVHISNLEAYLEQMEEAGWITQGEARRAAEAARREYRRAVEEEQRREREAAQERRPVGW